MYLLDANVLIQAQRDYYPRERVPEYWDWLVYHAEVGNIKVPQPIWDEIRPHDDDLRAWLGDNRDSFVLNPDESDVRVPDVLAQYGNDLTDDELEQIGADPFLIAAALHHDGTVVTKEGSKPAKRRQNRRVPDVCRDLNISCINDHRLIVELDFRTTRRP